MSLTQKFPPFRADIVGSFLRPVELKRARWEFSQSLISADELKAVEDECIVSLVGKEKEAGLQVATDGEFRRSYWNLDFFWGLGGVVHTSPKQGYVFHDEVTRADSACLNGRVRFNPHHPFLEHFKFLKSIVGDGVVPKQTIPDPAQLYAELTRIDNERTISLYYGDNIEALIEDIATAYHETILAFYNLGCRVLQLDGCAWGLLCDSNFCKALGLDVDRLLNCYLEVNNKAIEKLPADLIVTTHMCRGNYHSTWAVQGGYEPVAPVLFGKENVSAYYLEFDTERAGGFEPLRFVPSDKKVVLGLITTKYPALEDKEVVKKRILEASNYVPLDRLYLSPQCGFASTEEGNILTEEEQWSKIALVREIAADVWN